MGLRSLEIMEKGSSSGPCHVCFLNQDGRDLRDRGGRVASVLRGEKQVAENP